jgi:AcrR family transcriptional regulator
MTASGRDLADAAEPTLRSDAERNRKKVVEAAHVVFAEQGLDAPMAEVARRAGVGVATLYRRFPTREDLIADTFASRMTAYADAIDVALTNPDPWAGFCSYVEQVCEMQAADHGFTTVLTTTFPTATALEAERARAFRGFSTLISRAKAAGRLRADFSDFDLIMLLMANAGVVGATSDSAPDSWRRLVAYMLQAFSAENTAPLPAPPSGLDLLTALPCGQSGRAEASAPAPATAHSTEI